MGGADDEEEEHDTEVSEAIQRITKYPACKSVTSQLNEMKMDQPWGSIDLQRPELH